MTGLGGYYCPESNEFCPAGRVIGLPQKDGLVALKQLSVFQHTVSDQSFGGYTRKRIWENSRGTAITQDR